MGRISPIGRKSRLLCGIILVHPLSCAFRYGCRVPQQCLLLAMANTTASTSTPFGHQNPDLETCPVLPPNLVGPIQVWMDTPSIETLEHLYPDLEPGGHGQPKECAARHRVAIIIPYRSVTQCSQPVFSAIAVIIDGSYILLGSLEIARAT